MFFHHNGDYSGVVQISISSDVRLPRGESAFEEHEPWGQDSGHVIVRVQFDDLKLLLADYVRSNRMRELENMTDDELLGVTR